jgi:glycerophosphoryl diester phosphodiesterase
MCPLELPGRTKPYIIAHRGNRSACPENTLAAFQRALEDGADILETDLHLSREGVFVCIHDSTVDRTTDGRGAVADKSLAELKHLRAANGWPGFEQERIPTLAEVANLLPPDRALALELKSADFNLLGTALALAQELTRLGISDRTVVLSFSPQHLQTLRAVTAEIPIGLISLRNPLPAAGVELLGPYWPLLRLNPWYVQQAHRRGQIVAPLDPNPEARLARYLALGCDAILADDPGKIRQLLPAATELRL